MSTVDLIILATLGIFMILGIRDGILKSVFKLISTVLSWVISVYLSKGLSFFIYDAFISPSIVKNIESGFDAGSLTASSILDKFPKFLVSVMADYGITSNEINHIINSVNKEALPQEISKFIMPTMIQILSPFILGIIFLILSPLIRPAMIGISKVLKVKLINYTNRILGGILGVFKGYLFISVLLFVVKIIIPFGTVSGLEIFVDESSSSSIVFSHIYNNNPVYMLFEKA